MLKLFDPAVFIGMCEHEAHAIALKNSFQVRVVKRDGQEQEIHTDHRPWRYNFSIMNGIIDDVRMY